MRQVNDSFQLSFVNSSSDEVPISLFQLGTNDPNALRQINFSKSVDTGTTTGLPNTGVVTTDFLCFSTDEINSSGVFQNNGIIEIIFSASSGITGVLFVFNTGNTLSEAFSDLQGLISGNDSLKNVNATIDFTLDSLKNVGGTDVFPLTFLYNYDINTSSDLIPIKVNIQSDTSAIRSFPYSGSNFLIYRRGGYSSSNPNVTISGTDDYGEILNAQNGNEYEVYYIYALAPQGGSDVITIDRLDANGNSIVNSYTPVIDPYSFQNVYQVNPEGDNALDLNGRAKLSLTLAPNSRTQIDFYYRNRATSDAINNVQPLETDEGFERDNSKQEDYNPTFKLNLNEKNMTKEEAENLGTALKRVFGIGSGDKEKEKRTKELFNILIPLVLGYVAIRYAQ